jgi:ABC-2 type transport system ATP-binding protein
MSDATTLDEEIRPPAASPSQAAPVVVEVRGLEKTFRVPTHRVDSFKERATHPLTRIEYREHHVLRGISFEVHQGEFFGIVGRNGSGKSSLLKILASIYRADGGRVRTAGRVAPFIELGVGFNPELSARDNVVLNGVLMGLTRREAARRIDAVIEFAELEEFADLKIKNYSSGMMVRLAFAIMVQADADIMLVDEVLAVGDAAFAQKCMDVFHEKRRSGTTIILVTHDMTTVQSLCDRVMLIHDGDIRYIGDPEAAAMGYLRLNFAGPVGSTTTDNIVLDLNARVLHTRLLNAAGEAAETFEQGAPIHLDILMEAARELDKPVFVFHVVNDDGVLVFGFSRTLEEPAAAGRRIRRAGEIENRLVPGRYFLDCWIRRHRASGDMALQPLRLCSFLIFGTTPPHGVVSLRADVEPVLEPGP